MSATYFPRVSDINVNNLQQYINYGKIRSVIFGKWSLFNFVWAKLRIQNNTRKVNYSCLLIILGLVHIKYTWYILNVALLVHAKYTGCLLHVVLLVHIKYTICTLHVALLVHIKNKLHARCMLLMMLTFLIVTVVKEHIIIVLIPRDFVLQTSEISVVIWFFSFQLSSLQFAFLCNSWIPLQFSGCDWNRICWHICDI